ncbi:hypothetical protein M5K25_019175 [Dendrobium thyrsiflorum]|uniref:Uncharacterized protein n=1 Tax=Dendrobium thyrsiflorum TaxID=117978 RepID=A0ABD0UKZ7_DENTH
MIQERSTQLRESLMLCTDESFEAQAKFNEICQYVMHFRKEDEDCLLWHIHDEVMKIKLYRAGDDLRDVRVKIFTAETQCIPVRIVEEADRRCCVRKGVFEWSRVEENIGSYSQLVRAISRYGMAYLIACNKPPKAKVYNTKGNDYRRYYRIAKNHNHDKHVAWNSSSITKVSRSPSFLYFSFSFTQIFLLKMEYDQRDQTVVKADTAAIGIIKCKETIKSLSFSNASNIVTVTIGIAMSCETY